MINLTDLTTSQLNNIIAIKEKIEMLQSQIESIADGGETPISSKARKTRRGMSAAGRARIAAAQRARWAKLKGKGAKAAKKGKRRLSAAGRAAIIAGAKARWAKAKGKAATAKAAKKKDRRSSPAVRAKLAAAAKARWAKAKAEGKMTL
jgi:hypothetical protein